MIIVFLFSFSTFYYFSDKCSGKYAGYKLPYLGCRSYLSCMNGLPVPMCCPSGQIFSGSSGGNCVGAGSNVCYNDVCLSNWVRPTVGRSK